MGHTHKNMCRRRFESSSISLQKVIETKKNEDIADYNIKGTSVIFTEMTMLFIYKEN